MAGVSFDSQSFKPLVLANGGEEYIRKHGTTIAQAYDAIRREKQFKLNPRAMLKTSHRVPDGWKVKTPGVPTARDRMRIYNAREAAKKIAWFKGITTEID